MAIKRKMLLNLSMGASKFSLSGMLVYSKDYDTFRSQSIWNESSAYVRCRSCLSYPWGEMLAALAIKGDNCLYNLSMGGVACSSGHAGCACDTFYSIEGSAKLYILF